MIKTASLSLAALAAHERASHMEDQLLEDGMGKLQAGRLLITLTA
jgi:hypothetical protein